jgi:FtsP/CotA-like multicopper oxidase with cupredoxin domain
MMGGEGGGMGDGGMGGGGMGGGIIDPPVGGPFRGPPVLANLSQAPGIVEVSLEAARAPASVNGVTANLLTYNGLFPGGTIRAKTSDLLRVRFHNGLPDDGLLNYLGHPMYLTNLHTHGLHVTPGDNQNGTHGDNMLVML